jgi:uncharacterized protein YeaO (DUF488 family)
MIRKCWKQIRKSWKQLPESGRYKADNIDLAPTKELFDAIKGDKAGRIAWGQFEEDFRRLLKNRRIETTLDRSLFKDRTVLLCSEATSEHCHRRLVAEYLRDNWEGEGVTITHL